MWILRTFMSLMFLAELSGHNESHSRQRRYLIFTSATQFGAFVTISVPLHPESTVSLAYFFEANYYTVDNATYFRPLLGDIDTTDWQGRGRNSRSSKHTRGMFSRAYVYTFIEAMLERHGYPGRACMLRAICESGSAMLPQNGVVGDLLHLIFTPSTSLSEDNIEDIYYKAEYYGLEERCGGYEKKCPESPLDLISLHVEHVSHQND